jgi:hypothetical protein
MGSRKCPSTGGVGRNTNIKCENGEVKPSFSKRKFNYIKKPKDFNPFGGYINLTPNKS